MPFKKVIIKPKAVKPKIVKPNITNKKEKEIKNLVKQVLYNRASLPKRWKRL